MDKTIDILMLAQQAAEQIGDTSSRFKALVKIANAQLRFSCTDEAKQCFELAQTVAMATDSRDPNNRADCANSLVELASQQAAVDPDGAKKSFELAKGAAHKNDVLLTNIATTQAKVGYFIDAIQTAQLIEGDGEKAETLCSIAKILTGEAS